MKTTCFASDRVALTSRTVTDEGYLVAPGTLARTGVQEYRAFELGLKDGDPMRVLRLYRPYTEVFAAKSIASFEGAPITIDHPENGVTRDNWSQLAKGDVRNVARAGDLLAATLTIKSRDAIEALESGKREISNGYTFTLDLTPGVTPSGEPYDGVQRNIKGNHVALVDAARCGSACRVADTTLPTHQQGTRTMTEVLRKVVVDGIPVEVSETAAAAIDKLTKARDEAEAKLKAAPAQAVLDALNQEVKTLKDANTAKDKEIEALKKDVVTPAARDAMVSEWARLIEDGKRLMPNLTTDGKTCHAIRKEVLSSIQDAALTAAAAAVIGDKKIADLDETTARTAFAVVAAIKPSQQAASDGMTAQALLGTDGGSVKVFDARSLWAANLNNTQE